ncbi:MAG: S8 family serine peptidase [Candidatus Alcyoniella australis]|nr:S8 family serine peptidase [Candidatus Alcyoniella australis]
MTSRTIAVLFVALCSIALAASGAAALSIVDQFPTFQSKLVQGDTPLSVRFSDSLEGATLGDSTFFVALGGDDAHLAGSLVLSSIVHANDTVVFTPSAAWPWGERIELHVGNALHSASGDPFDGAYPFGALFVCNIPNDFEIPIYDPGDPFAMFTETSVLMGFNPIEPESAVEGPWMIPGINVTGAWKYSTGSPDVLVAVVDDGLKHYEDEDLRIALFINSGELPLPQTASGVCADYDCNGDGRFDVDDYADDPRVEPLDRAINVGDLLAEFSDGVDDDKNGLVDDISGWDFFRNTNEVLGVDDFPEGAHGHGMCELAAARGNNGIGNRPGVCPDCRVMQVRVGDAVIYNYDLFAAGVRYAVSMGADVINHSGVALNYSDQAHRAVMEAYDAGVLIAAPQGDEMSMHHWAPAAMEDVVAVTALFPIIPVDLVGIFNLGSFGFVETYCTNFGTHAHVAVPADTACTSDATGTTTGAMALIKSYALEQGIELSAGELFQLLIQSADDIESHCASVASLLNVCQPGWDEHFGYGRPDLERALLMLGDEQRGIEPRIPPEVRITYPRWWETFDTAASATFELEGEIDARVYPFSYEVQLARGKQPLDNEYQTVFQGTSDERIEGLIAQVPIAQLFPPDQMRGVPQSRYDFEVSLRVRAWYEAGIDEQVRGEARKSISVHVDDDPVNGLAAGFPYYFGASPGFSPIVYDLDGAADGLPEIVMGTGDGLVHVLTRDVDGSGWSELAGFPVDLSSYDQWRSDGIIGSVAIGDLFGDGEPEIVAATALGRVFAIHADGNLHQPSPILPGFPVQTDAPDNSSSLAFGHGNGVYGSPVLVDLDLDGVLEIVVASNDQKAYAWKPLDQDGNGQVDPLYGWPVLCRSDEGIVRDERICEGSGLPSQICSTPAAGVLDPLNANPDVSEYPSVVVATTEICEEGLLATTRAYAIYHDGWANPAGTFLPDWPAAPAAPLGDAIPLPFAAGGVSSPVIALGNGEAWIGLGTPGWFPAVMHYSGEKIHEMYMPTGLSLTSIAHGAFTSLYNDGWLQYSIPLLSVLQIGEEGFNLINSKLAANDVDPPHERLLIEELEDLPMFNSPAAADLNADGTRELVLGTSGYLAHAFSVDGIQPPGWPKYTQKWITGSAAIADIDADGLLEVLLPTYEGWLYAWETGAASCIDGEQNADWPRFHHDPHNSGYYGLDALPPARVTDLQLERLGDRRLKLTFTAPGDDWTCGQAQSYDVRISRDPAADLEQVEQFAAAEAFEFGAAPQPPGSIESFIVPDPGVLHVALRVADDEGNLSRISNAVSDLPGDDDDDDASDGDDDDDSGCCG